MRYFARLFVVAPVLFLGLLLSVFLINAHAVLATTKASAATSTVKTTTPVKPKPAAKKIVVKKPVVKKPAAKPVKKPAAKPTQVKATTQSPAPALTISGILTQTNVDRANAANLAALSLNETLNHAAAVRLHDMFSKQYFDHVSPTGAQPSSVVTDSGYEFITFGENIALGDFASDKALVDAWMNSPHHRENILNSKYTEIGIAVGRSYYQGSLTWIAVQEFARPRSICGVVDANLKAVIDGKTQRLDLMNADADRLLSELQSARPVSNDDIQQYNLKANAYNDLANQINTENATLKNLIVQYNNKVDSVNACLAK